MYYYSHATQDQNWHTVKDKVLLAKWDNNQIFSVEENQES